MFYDKVLTTANLQLVPGLLVDHNAQGSLHLCNIFSAKLCALTCKTRGKIWKNDGMDGIECILHLIHQMTMLLLWFSCLQIMRDPETGNSKGFAFINFASFDASDAAMEAMNGQYLCNRPITISYAFKKESKGERHGSAAGIEQMMTMKILCTSLHGNLMQCIVKLHLS